MKNKRIPFFKRLQEKLTADEMFHETEVQANRLGATILFNSGLILLLIMALTALGVFPLSWESVFAPSIQAIVEIAILMVLCLIAKNDAWWLKPLLLIGLVFVYARLDSMLTHKAAILMVIPVVFSSRYFSRRLTVFTAILSTAAFAGSAYWGATHGMINLNIVILPAGRQIVTTGDFLGEAVKKAGAEDSMLIANTMLFDYLPRWLMFSIASVISCNIARRGRDMVVTQHEKDVKSARIESELHLATSIQADMLPNIFPAFPERSEFDIYATMDPAKEVGGDFYDFFLIDDDHLCMVMADVSGKGVPAALFMMASKIILANNAMMGKTPGQILTDTNAAICSNNREEMFVTVWLGILEISTGKLTAANAGHEYPAIRYANGAFELYKDKHGFVIGGMDGARYREYELTLTPGSKLFLYTDGVPEATDAREQMFGVENMLASLNGDASAAPEEILKNVRASVDGFVKQAEQFDDLTMLCLEYKGTVDNKQEEQS
ncbi:MAG: PP2C family protein-serine/threonine phosphatase [Oscillospiraceae bacterium]|nr:PP2C family protein-serine/threonine phosphatase [Oscillospiraceae bacterium]